MRYLCALLLCVAVIGTLGFPRSGRADIGPVILAGGSASPMSAHGAIRMDSMEVTIRLKMNSFIVDAVFSLFNTGKAMTQWVGFPKYGAAALSGEAIDFMSFSAWVDGKPEPFVEERDLFRNQSPFFSRTTGTGTEESRWMLKQLVFPGHARKTIRVRYEAEYAGDRFAFYLYGTGRYWKGNIGKATFIIDSTDVGGTKNTSQGFGTTAGARFVTENLTRYEIADFEPALRARFSIERYKKYPPMIQPSFNSMETEGEGNSRVQKE